MAAVLVTGATGFVGAHLIARLAAAGHEVHALVRPSSPLELLRDHATPHLGSLEDPGSLQRALAAVRPDAVVHGAALISYRTADAEAARRVNVEGTRALLDACQAHGVRRFVLVSSIVAVGQAAARDAELDEDAPFHGAALRSHYVTTKRAAEDFAFAVGKQLDVVVVNPGAIFGPPRIPARRDGSGRSARGTCITPRRTPPRPRCGAEARPVRGERHDPGAA